MRQWAFKEETAGGEGRDINKEFADKAVAATAANTTPPEKPIAVKVPPRPLLDVAVVMEHSNPNCCMTLFSTFVTAALMGLCFVVVGVPPVFLDEWKGKRIYVGIMVPLLTLLCTVLLYYVMQQPQRAFNTALMKMVKEMEHHSNYLSVAVDNVEKELNARGVNLNPVGASSNNSANVMNVSLLGGRPRSHLATPDELAMQRTLGESPVTPKTSLLCSINNFSGISGTDFLHGMDKLDESHDVIIATVRVGKEWGWFKDMLGHLKKSSLAGPSFLGFAYQRTMVRMLSTAIARVEKLILSLYFSSFLLHKLNLLAPLNLWGTPAACVEGNRGDMHSRAVAALARGNVECNNNVYCSGGVAPTTQRSSLHLLGGSEESPTESTFTLGNKESGTADVESPVFSTSARGQIEVRKDSETHTELTPPSQGKGFTFGNRVRLPQFTPLTGIGEMTPREKEQRPSQKRQQQKPQVASPTGARRAEAKETTDAEAALQVVPSTQRRKASTASPAPPPLQRSVTKVGGTYDGLSEKGMRSASDADNGEVKEDVDVEGVATPLAKARSELQMSTKETAPHSIVVVQNRLSAAAADDDGINGEIAFSPVSPVPTQQSRRLADEKSSCVKQQAPLHFDATPRKQEQHLASFDTTNAPFAAVSPPPVKPPLSPSPSFQQQQLQVGGATGGRPRRQPGTAVVQNPILTLHRGARFMNDEESFFMTVLVHVRKARITCFSRLYAAQGHVKSDGTERKYYFANSVDSSVIRRCSYNPFTLFHISDVGGEREGLTVQEQHLLNLVYCRPEHYSAINDNEGRSQNTDLSSLAVKDDVGNMGSPTGTGETASPPTSLPHRNTTSVYAEEVDAFIVAMGVLPDRPMRLTFLPVHIGAVGSKGLSSSFSTSTSSFSPKAAPGMAKSSDAGVTQSDPEVFLPPLKTLPVLECVIDDVLCVLTRMEVTVDVSFKKVSRILLVGVSLEDLSEGSERGVDEEDDLDSLAAAQGTKKPIHSSTENSPKERCIRGMVTPQAPLLSGGGGCNHTCTVGQEFREVIMVEEQDSVSTEPSQAST